MSKSYDKRFEFTVDTSRVEKLFKALEYKNQAKAIKYGLRAAANMITKQAKKNLKSKMGKAATHKHEGWGRKHKDGTYDAKSLIQGIRTAVDKKNGMYAVAHIRGNGLLHLFEAGTAMRYKNNLKHSSTGQLKALYFFKSAIETEQETAKKSLTKCVEQQIKKIYDKHKR